MVLAGAPDGRERDEAARALLEWGFAEFSPQVIVPAGLTVGSALVQDGASDSVELRAPQDIVAAFPQNAPQGAITTEIVYRGPVMAPIAAGDPIARLRLRIDGEQVLEVPLEAAQSIQRANVFQRVANAVQKWLT
jgi:D-alanyl-D-alanine carboxypeptidase (penicillin-binding protein 5/6)